MAIYYVRAQELARQLGVSRATIWLWAKDGRLPPPIKLGPRVTVWDMAKVEKWIEDLGVGDA